MVNYTWDFVQTKRDPDASKQLSIAATLFASLTILFAMSWQMQDNWPSVLIAMAGGLALSLGNLVSQYAWAFAGLSLTNVICASMTVVSGAYIYTYESFVSMKMVLRLLMLAHHSCSGTTINYFLDGRINRAEILFPGVVCFLMAVFLGAAVHSSNAKDDEQKLSMSDSHFFF